jgi:hypothetical protein
MIHAFVLIKADREAMHAVAFEVFSQHDLEATFSIGA